MFIHNKIEKFKHFTTCTAKFRVIRWVIAPAICLVMASCDTKITDNTEALDKANILLWQQPEKAMTELERMAEISMTNAEYMRWKLLYEHARLKTGLTVSSDSLTDIIAFFVETKQYELAGEAYYIRGVAWLNQEFYYPAMLDMRRAEEYLRGSSNTELRALVLHKMGCISEQDNLHEEGLLYYRQGLEMLTEKDTSIYRYYFLRDIARLYANMGQTDSAALYFDMAQADALSRNDSAEWVEIAYYRLFPKMIMPLNEVADIDSLTALERHRLQRFGHTESAYTLATIYLYQNQLDSFAHYVKMWAVDTIHDTDTKNKYCELQAQYLYKKGDYKRAYERITQLYTSQYEQMKKQNKLHTYRIAHEYELSKEHERTMQLLIERQRLVMWFSLLCFIIFVAGAIITYRYHKVRKERTALALENQAKEKVLVRQLSEQVSITHAIQKQQLYHTSAKKTEQWLQEVQAQWRFTNTENWERYLNEFDNCHDHLLDRLKTENPRLTDSDLQYITLHLLGFNTKDISILLDVTPPTLWTRRQRIKEHLNVEINNLDQWISTIQ